MLHPFSPFLLQKYLAKHWHGELSKKERKKRTHKRKKGREKKKKKRRGMRTIISNVHTFQGMGSFFRIRSSSILDYIYLSNTSPLLVFNTSLSVSPFYLSP
jgi:hypothetical protein